MEDVYEFLKDLQINNNREWFALNKNRYLRAQSIFNNFVEDLIKEISSWDNDIDPNKISVKDCTYRIYRDIRFSKNKNPYKTHLGAYICKGGKKSPYAGYYFHIEPPMEESTSLIGANMLFAGLYSPDTKIIFSIRDEILVNGDVYINAINLAKGFNFDYSNALKKLPKGFEDTPEQWQQLIKCKEFSLYKKIEESNLYNSNLTKFISENFKNTLPFIKLLNRAVDYANDQI